MKKKTKKKLITLLVLLLVLCVAIVGYCLLKSINEAPEEDTEEDTSVTVFDKGTAIVTAISFKSEDSEMSFTYVNDDWQYDADTNFPLDQDRVASMASAIGTVSATVTVKDASEDLSVYGLAPAPLTVNAAFSDGSEKTFLFGDTNSFNNCQYLTISGDENVYMVEEDVSSPFAADLDYLYEPESFELQKNSVTDSNVTAITVTTKGNSKEITDSAGITELYELVYTLDLSEYEDYYADKGEMADTYGISDAGEKVTVSYTLETENSDGTSTKVPKEYTVYIGHKYENAEKEAEDTSTGDDTTAAEEDKEYYYFYTFNGSTVVYSADGETVDDIFAFLAYEPAAEETTANE